MKCYIFFLPLCIYYCYQILCFSMSNYLNAYNQFLFILTVALCALYVSPPPPPPPLRNCVVYLNLTGYQMKA